MVPRGEAPAMIAEVETEALPSLRIQLVGNGSVIESLPNPRMAVKASPVRARGRRRPRRPDRRRSRLSHCKHPNIPGPELDVILGEERFPGQNVVHLGGHGYGGGIP